MEEIIIEIKLSSSVITITNIKRKTNAKMFCNLNVGDRIKFSVPIKYAGHNRSTYATYITIIKLETGEQTQLSFNQLPIILNAFEFTDEQFWEKCKHCKNSYYGLDTYSCKLTNKCKFEYKKEEIK